jgi:protein-L-isoaspartate(D-aspartate) O-methyltransferase
VVFREVVTDDERFQRLLAGGGLSPSARNAMVARLRSGGVRDPRVLAAMAAVAREEFVAEGFEEAAYADRALPIGYRQTISQPLMVAIMVEALELRGGERVLDVGTGSGYQAAVLTQCGARVLSIERIPALARAARNRLARLGYDVEVIIGDATLPIQDHGRFDVVVVAAAAPRPPLSLLTLLDRGGRMLIPLRHGGRDEHERLTRIRRIDTPAGGIEYQQDDLGPCRFVPLVGVEGFHTEDA